MKSVVILITLSLFLLAGCGTVEDVIYLQDIEVTTPLNIPPLHISSDANKDKVTFSPRLYINNKTMVEGTLEHSPVNQYGIYDVDTIDNRLKESPDNRYNYSGKNIHWTIPDYTVGFDLNIPVSSVFSFNAALSISRADNDDLLGATFGISLGKLADNHSFRFSGGFTWQQFQYSAQTAMVRTITGPFRSPEQYVTLFEDHGTETDANFYLTLLYNSAFPDWIINFYLGMSYFRQSIFDFGPTNTQVDFQPFYIYTSTDARGESAGGFFNFSPGLYKDLSEWLRLSGGVNFVTGTTMENSSESSYLLPYFKIDFFL